MRVLLATLFLLNYIGLSGQNSALVVNNGLWHTESASLVTINGSFHNNSTADLSGTLYLRDSLVNTDEIFQQGVLIAEGHILNNGIWHENNGELRLNGNNQDLRGTQAIVTGQLTCSGNGDKFLFTDVLINQILKLDSHSLHINQQTVSIIDTALNSLQIENARLFIDENGKLIRGLPINQFQTFPLTSSNINRVISVSSNQTGLYGVQIKNNDASTNGFIRFYVDSATCSTQSSHYYLISQETSTTAVCQIEITSPDAADFNFNSISAWNDQGEGVWQQQFQNSVLANNQLSVLSNPFAASVSQPIILSRKRPEIPVLAGPNQLCAENPMVFTIENPDNALLYNWTAGDGQSATGSAFQPSSNSAGFLNISATATDNLNCTSFSAQTNVQINPLPVAQIIVTEPNLPFTFELYTFDGQSSTFTQTMNWLIDGNEMNQDFLWVHRFEEPGSYEVSLIAESDAGCLDTATVNVIVEEGFIIPTIFTPNGDGFNDYWTVKNSKFSQFHISVFNRFGQIVFESKGPSTSWNGLAPNNEACPDGTYFYVVKADLPSKTIDLKGSITLVR